MKVLISGAGGFVGKHLVSNLQSAGHETIPLDRRSSSGMLSCDITNMDDLRRCVQECQPDVFVHLAGMAATNIKSDDIGKLAEVNVLGTYNACQAASELPRVTFLFASSGLVYGTSPTSVGFSERDIPQPSHAYAESKLAAEHIVRTFGVKENFDGYVVRPFNHIGPFQGHQFVVPDFGKRIKEASNGDDILVGDLEAERDFTDVRDIVEAYRLIIERQPKEKLFVLGSGTTLKIGEILSKLLDISGKSLNIKQKSDLMRSNSHAKRLFGDFSLAREVLGWAPKIPIDKTLCDAYESF